MLNLSSTTSLVILTNVFVMTEGGQVVHDLNQEPITRSIHTDYIHESTFARIFLFLELTLQQETHIYINLQTLICRHCFCYFGRALTITLFVQSRRTRGVLKIERYGQRLTHRACMGDASSYSWAPDSVQYKSQWPKHSAHIAVY